MSLFHEISQLDNFNYSFKLGVTRSDILVFSVIMQWSYKITSHLHNNTLNPRSGISLMVTVKMEYGAIIKHSHEFAVETKAEYVRIH